MPPSKNSYSKVQLELALDIMENVAVLLSDASKWSNCLSTDASGGVVNGCDFEATSWDWLSSIGRVCRQPVEKVYLRHVIQQYYMEAIVRLRYAPLKESMIFLNSHCTYEQFLEVLAFAQSLLEEDIKLSA